MRPPAGVERRDARFLDYFVDVLRKWDPDQTVQPGCGGKHLDQHGRAPSKAAARPASSRACGVVFVASGSSPEAYLAAYAHVAERVAAMRVPAGWCREEPALDRYPVVDATDAANARQVLSPNITVLELGTVEAPRHGIPATTPAHRQGWSANVALPYVVTGSGLWCAAKPVVVVAQSAAPSHSRTSRSRRPPKAERGRPMNAARYRRCSPGRGAAGRVTQTPFTRAWWLAMRVRRCVLGPASEHSRRQMARDLAPEIASFLV